MALGAVGMALSAPETTLGDSGCSGDKPGYHRMAVGVLGMILGATRMAVHAPRVSLGAPGLPQVLCGWPECFEDNSGCHQDNHGCSGDDHGCPRMILETTLGTPGQHWVQQTVQEASGAAACHQPRGARQGLAKGSGWLESLTPPVCSPPLQPGAGSASLQHLLHPGQPQRPDPASEV